MERFFQELFAVPAVASQTAGGASGIDCRIAERLWPLPGLGGEPSVEIVVQSLTYMESEGEGAGVLHLLKMRLAKSGLEPANSAARDSSIRKCVHDLANVFGILLPSVEALAEDGLDGSDSQVILTNLQKTAERGAALIRQLGSALAEARNSPPIPDAIKPTPKPSAQPKPANAKAPSGYERILLVDDDPHYRTLLKAALGYRGYQITPAGDADEALKLLEREGEVFNVLVSDLNLPGMDGLELIAEARKRRPHLRCVVLSGSPREASNGAVPPEVSWILKPYSTEELVAKLREAFEEKV